MRHNERSAGRITRITEEADFFWLVKLKPLNGFRKFLQDSLCVELCVVNRAQNAAAQLLLWALEKIQRRGGYPRGRRIPRLQT